MQTHTHTHTHTHTCMHACAHAHAVSHTHTHPNLHTHPNELNQSMITMEHGDCSLSRSKILIESNWSAFPGNWLVELCWMEQFQFHLVESCWKEQFQFHCVEFWINLPLTIKSHFVNVPFKNPDREKTERKREGGWGEKHYKAVNAEMCWKQDTIII